MVEKKRDGNLWQRRKRQLNGSVEIVESAKNMSPFLLEHGGMLSIRRKP